MCSLHLTHPSAHTPESSGQPTLRRPGSSWGFGALLKGLTSVVDNSCQSRDSNPQPWITSGFKSNALSIRPRLPKLVGVGFVLFELVIVFYSSFFLSFFLVLVPLFLSNTVLNTTYFLTSPSSDARSITPLYYTN